jgi:hypothetical protein
MCLIQAEIGRFSHFSIVEALNDKLISSHGHCLNAGDVIP